MNSRTRSKWPSNQAARTNGTNRAHRGSSCGRTAPNSAVAAITATVPPMIFTNSRCHSLKAWVSRATLALACIAAGTLCQYQRAAAKQNGSQANVHNATSRTARGRMGSSRFVTKKIQNQTNSPAVTIA